MINAVAPPELLKKTLGLSLIVKSDSIMAALLVKGFFLLFKEMSYPYYHIM